MAYLMLELGWIAAMYRNSCPINMELANNAASSCFGTNELRPESTFLRTFPQSQQANENILFRIFVRQEGFPTSVGDIISAK